LRKNVVLDTGVGQLMRIQNLSGIMKLGMLVSILLTGVVNAAPPIAKLEFAIAPKFDDAGDFSEGLAKVGFDDSNKAADPYGYVDLRSYGYIDRTGKLKIPAQFSEASNFAEGLAAVRIKSKQQGKNSLYGYIDKTGKSVIAPQFTFAGKFSGGLAPVVALDGKGYINRRGKIVFKLKYDSIGEFSEGLAPVGIEVKGSAYKNQKYGYIDRQGRLVIPLKFIVAGKFSEGLALAELPHNGTKGYINKLGKFTIKNQQLDIYRAGEFYEGMAAVEFSSGACSAAAYCEYKYIDRQGKIVFPAQFVSAGAFSSGIAPVATGGGGRDAGGFYPATNWGFINKQGKFVTDNKFNDAGTFSEGLARVKIDGKYGYIRP
jgi:WG containing repeat